MATYGRRCKIKETEESNEQRIQAYTDESKNVDGVGTRVANFIDKAFVVQLKFKLDSRCTNNQAEQLAIAKVVEVIKSVDV
jgi:ribonuclease HI